MRTNRKDGDLLTCISRCALAVFLPFFFLSGVGLAQQEPSKDPPRPQQASSLPMPVEPPKVQLTEAQRRVRELPRSATSTDGFVEVLAADVPGDTMGFRLPLLRFTSQFVEELEHTYGLQMPRNGGRGLVLHALDGQTNDIRVISRVVQRDGRVLTRLWLPSPGYTNIEALRFEIAQAYFRAWIDRHRPADSTELADELPKWFTFGALNARTTEDAHTAIRAVLKMRLEKQLPEFPKYLLELKKISTLQDAILAGYVVAWLKERRDFVAVLERLAAGQPWSTEELLVTLTGEKTAAEQRRVLEERLERQSRAVLSPGRASDWDIQNFCAQLRLEVVQSDEGDQKGKTSVINFRTALKLAAKEPSVRLAAQRKMRELPMYAVQRGPGMAAVSEEYSRFLVMLSRGADAETLVPLLDAAEAKLKEIIENGGELAPKAVEDENGKNNNR